MSRKQENSTLTIFLLPMIFALATLGCGLSSLAAQAGSNSGLGPTRTPMPTFTPTVAGAAFVEVPPLEAQPASPGSQEQAVAEVTVPETVEPSPTPTLEPTVTPTPDDTVTITVLQNMNVRGGPGTNYFVVGAGTPGQSAKVTGRNADGSWLQVEYPSADGVGWVYTSLVEVKGNAETIAVVQAPAPPPQPVAVSQPEPEPEPEEQGPPPAPEVKYQFTPTGWHASHNAAIVHFKGRIRDEGGNLINGYSVMLNNGAYSVISHPTGASHHYPEKGDGEWDVSGIPLKDAVGWWWLSVVLYECPNFVGEFNAQCKQFTRLSEEVKIQVVYPDETVINADWICHWDCDKGLYVQAYRRP